MPYASNAELPSEVRDALPEAAQTVFRRVVTEEENKGKSESQAFATAWTAVKNGWHKNDKDEWVRKSVTVAKVSDELGLVFGWAIISKMDGQEYYDTQGDYISEDVMLKAAADYMQGGAVAKEMHVGEAKGRVVFAWPMTADIAKSMGIDTNQTGLMIAMKPDSPEMLKKFHDGTYTGFSIGGRGERHEVE